MEPEAGIAALDREVSASVPELVRGLRTAFGEGLTGGPLQFRARGCGAAVEIALTPGPDRALGLLRLPTLRLHVRFTEGDDAARARLLAHMDLAMHRGGG